MLPVLDAEDDGEDSSSSSVPSVLELQRRAAQRKPLIITLQADSFKSLLIGWIIGANIPFTVVEHPLFCQLLLLLNADLVIQLLPCSGDTIKRWIKAEYKKYLVILKSEIKACQTRVHLSFDLWSSPNGLAILSLFAYYIDKAGKPQFHLLALDQVKGSHSGKNQASLIIAKIKEFGFSSQVGFLTIDNIDLCDSCIQAIFRSVSPHLAPERQSRIEKTCHIRCIGHVLNLLAKAFLKGSSSDIFDYHLS